MVRRKHRGGERHARHAIGPVLVVLPALVQHHVALVPEFLLGERGQQVAHPVRFHPERQFERAGRHDLPVVGAVGARRSVEQRAGPLQRREEAVIVVFGPLEHQVFEQVGEAGAPGPLVLRSHVVPEVHRHHRQLVILVHDDVQAVGQRSLGVGYVHCLGLILSASRESGVGSRATERMLAIVCVAEFLGMTLWFSATAVTPQLIREFGIAPGQAPWLTMAVQAGFVVGTLVSAIANLADLLNPRMLMFARLARRRGRERRRARRARTGDGDRPPVPAPAPRSRSCIPRG